MPRFVVKTLGDAAEEGWYELNKYDDDWCSAIWDTHFNPPELIATACMEPEDVSFYRDLAWVPKLLNELAGDE